MRASGARCRFRETKYSTQEDGNGEVRTESFSYEINNPFSPKGMGTFPKFRRYCLSSSSSLLRQVWKQNFCTKTRLLQGRAEHAWDPFLPHTRTDTRVEYIPGGRIQQQHTAPPIRTSARGIHQQFLGHRAS